MFHFTYSYPSSRIILLIFCSAYASSNTREGLKMLRRVCFHLRHRNYVCVSLTSGVRCLIKQLCRVQFVQRLVSTAMYRPSNIWCPPKLMRRPINGSICVRNHVQSVCSKIGSAIFLMQSLATYPVTRQTSGKLRVTFSRGNIFPSNWVGYQGLHQTTRAAKYDKYTYLTSGVDVATAAVVTRMEFKGIFK